MTDKLLPCPFCGGAADFCDTGIFWVRCDDCGADAEGGEDFDEATRLWNRRHSPPAERLLAFPRDLTDDLRDVLSTMLWTSGQIAHCLRAGGENIKTRAEDEQAHVLHWMICLALEHGSEWRAKASDRIREIQASLKAAASEGSNDA